MKFGRTLLVGTGLAIGLATSAIVAPIAIAQTDNDTFYGCEKDGNLIPGSLSINNAPTSNGSATLIEWKQQGEPGIQGEAGADGADGDQGIEGEPGPGVPEPEFDSCVGTYLTDFGGSPALWTFSGDGTLQATDSNEDGRPNPFGHNPFSH
jgi:hypothetical protein